MSLYMHDVHQCRAAYRWGMQLSDINSATSPACVCPTTARLCSPVSLAPGHSLNSTLLPILPIHSNIHRVHLHNYRFLLDVSVCVSVCVWSFPINAQHIIRCWTGRQGPYIVSNADHKHALALKTRFVLYSIKLEWAILKGGGGGLSMHQWEAFDTSTQVHVSRRSTWGRGLSVCVCFCVSPKQSCAIVQSAKVNASLSCSNR